MSSLTYRIVTNWPASMNEDFTFQPNEDRSAHYDLCTELLSCIADEKHPEQFRITEEIIYEHEVVRPREPALPRMPFPAELLEGDTAFMDLCHGYTFTDEARFAKVNSINQKTRITVTEYFTLEGDELLHLAQLAKHNRAEAKFRFILASYGVSEGEIHSIAAESSASTPSPAVLADSSEEPGKPKKAKKGKKGKKSKADKKSAGKKRSKKGEKDGKGKKGKSRKKA